MHPEPDDSEPLRRLLAWKRHEQPPPGYFDELPRRIMLRIQSEHVGEESAGVGQLFWEAPWLQKLLLALDRRQALAGTLGLGVALLLLAGILFSVAPVEPKRTSVLHASDTLPTIAALQTEPAQVFVSSTNGLMPQPLPNSLFGQPRNPFQVKPFLVSQPGMISQ